MPRPWAFSPRTLIFFVFFDFFEVFAPAKSVLQPRPAVLELLLEMPCLPVVWQPCQGSREACSVETFAGEALKSCSGLSVQVLPSGLQF